MSNSLKLILVTTVINSLLSVSAFAEPIALTAESVDVASVSSSTTSTTVSSTTSTTIVQDPCTLNHIYRIHGDMIGITPGTNIFAGNTPSCLVDKARSCGFYNGKVQVQTAVGVYSTQAYSDDCLMGVLLTGTVRNNGTSTWWTTQANPNANIIPAGVTIDRTQCYMLRICQMFEFTVHIDSNCNKVVDPAYFCSEGTVRAIVSPVSLEWYPGAMKLKKETLVNFKLIPSKSEYWYSWRASGELPLLVYDPKHKGIISDGTQLFGFNTFGRNWKNGYEAMASLDANGDKRLSDSELADLGLWFDYNQDGVSQTGEVQSLKELRITSLGVGPVQDLGGEEDIVLANGFEREIDGRVISGASVDWFSQLYQSKTSAALDSKRFFADVQGEYKLEKAQLKELARRAEGKLTKWQGDSLAGSWEWRLLDNANSTTNNQSIGVLQIQDIGVAEIQGYSLIETGSKGIDQHVVKGHFLLGKKYKTQNGNTAVKFEIETVKGNVTKSTAELSLDGRRLIGESVVTLPYGTIEQRTIKYKWEAVKITG